MKTVLIGPFTATRVPGGVGMRLRALYRALNQPGHTCSFLPVAADQFAGCSAGCELTSHQASAEPGDPFAIHFCRRLLDRLTRQIRAERPDAIVVSNLQLHRYAVELSRLDSAPLVFDMHNVEYDLMRAMLEYVPGEQRAAMGMDTACESLRHFERRVVSAASQVWVCGETDRLAAQRLYEPFDIRRVPNIAPVPLCEVPDRPSRAVFTGRFDYYPNLDAYSVLAGEVAPLVPEASIVVAGAGVAAVAHLGQAPANVTLIDNPHDVTGLIADSVMVVPLRLGGGTRLKVLEALGLGAPVISTGKGVEGLDIVDGLHFLRAETPAEFAAAMQRVLGDASLSAHLRAHGRAIVNERYSPAALATIVRECLSGLDAPARQPVAAAHSSPR